MERNGLTYQQKLAWSLLHDGLDTIREGTDRIEKRGERVFAGSSAAVATLAAVNLLPQSIEDASRAQGVLLATLCASLLVMFRFAAQLWQSRTRAVPGSADVDALYDQYIAQSMDDAFNTAMLSTEKALEITFKVNEARAKTLGRMVATLHFQAANIILLVLAKVFGW